MAASQAVCAHCERPITARRGHVYSRHTGNKFCASDQRRCEELGRARVRRQRRAG